MTSSSTKPVKVLFVCLGNICRSPTAHALFQAKVNAEKLDTVMSIDSAGTAGWHTGLPPDQRAQKMALAHGYDMNHLQARQVCTADFDEFDYILAMDNANLKDLRALQPPHFSGVLGLFLTEAGLVNHTGSDEVPDPYYGDSEHFEQVINLVQEAVASLLERIKTQHRL